MNLKPSDIFCHPGVSIINDPTVEALAEAIIKLMMESGDEWKAPSVFELRDFISSYPSGAFPSSISNDTLNKAILLCWDKECCLRFSSKWRDIAKQKDVSQD